METDKGQILLYQTPDGESRIEVRLKDGTVWLSLDQMAELFQRNKSTTPATSRMCLRREKSDKKQLLQNLQQL